MESSSSAILFDYFVKYSILDKMKRGMRDHEQRSGGSANDVSFELTISVSRIAEFVRDFQENLFTFKTALKGMNDTDVNVV